MVAAYSPIHIEAVVLDLQRMLLKSMADTRRLDTLRELCGYVADGSHSSVSLSQDDATGAWIVSVGATQPHMKGHGRSLCEAIDACGA
jgi:hypothetical protein